MDQRFKTSSLRDLYDAEAMANLVQDFTEYINTGYNFNKQDLWNSVQYITRHVRFTEICGTDAIHTMIDASISRAGFTAKQQTILGKWSGPIYSPEGPEYFRYDGPDDVDRYGARRVGMGRLGGKF
ncbi:hypothetical protein J8273_4308 [Carpediemonas membranifera]|uniref:Uncharacterized protein n=1 Tax=Carpediemonas membranifera TaxID=201153 RepID=A0A8J6BY74_9EUKA|nr:hypothetical protein J8273_4308 [Carpediemonas membranifera]|eukprot:KAG9394206.1 hypothetical protein J8273_4308 [Carpediemonas membranifera]